MSEIKHSINEDIPASHKCKHIGCEYFRRKFIPFAVAYTLLCILVLLMMMADSWVGAVIVGIPLLFSCAIIWLGVLQRFVIDANGITEYLVFRRRYIPKEDIRTIVHRIPYGYRGDLIPMLLVTSDTKEAILASGAQQLGKKSFIRHELPFLKRRNDWEAICIGAWKCGNRTIAILYSEEREKLLREKFPDAEFCRGKRHDSLPEEF